MRTTVLILCLVLVAAIPSKGYAASLPAAQEAREQANCGQWQKAIESYNKALASSPRDASCLARRGFAYARLGNLKQGFADFAAAIECDTTCPDAYSRRSRVYSWLGLNQLAQRDAHKALELIGGAPKEPDLLLEHAGCLYIVEKKQEADEESKQVLVSNPTASDVSSLLIAANAHRNLNHFQDSIHCLTQAIKLSPNSVELHWLRAGSYAALGRWTLASADMDQVMHTNQKNPIALCGRGYCYYYQGKDAKAVAAYDEAIKIAPNYARAFYSRGLAYHHLKNNQKAVEDFTNAIKLDPTDALSYEERAENYCHQREWKKALKDTHQAILLNPKSWEAYVTQGWAHNELNQFAEALEDSNKAIALMPKESAAYYNRGMCFREQRQYKKAIDDITEAIKYNSTDPIYFCARGSAFASDHQYKLAIADCTESLKLDPTRTHPHFTRGLAYARLGNSNLALKDLNEAIRQSPKYGEAYFERSLVYKSLGKTALSKRDLEKAKAFGYGSPEAMN